MMNSAAGIPIPDLTTGQVAFTVPEASLVANATYTRDDGQIVHYIDKPSVIERAWTETNHHILIKFTDAFGIIGEVEPEEVILGRAFTTFCQNDVTHVKDAWYYVYTSPTFDQEKRGVFPLERFLLGNCREGLNPFRDRYTGKPRIRAGDLVYFAVPPAEILKLETAKHGEGLSGKLRAATSVDTDKDGLLDLVEEKLESKANDFDSDNDGIGDGLEVAGGDAGTLHLAADTIGWSNPDTDRDGLYDATELGFTAAQNPKPDESPLFVADSDPSTTTKPNALDTDGVSICDGAGSDACVNGEDRNKNGKVDEGETDPKNKDDDVAPPLPPPPAKDQCKNGADDDGDTLIDLRDAGCTNADDQNEGDGATDLEVKKTGPAGIANGSKITYSIRVTNKGPDAVTSAAAILDDVPPGLVYIDAESDSACDPEGGDSKRVRCGNIKIAKDAERSFTLVFNVQAADDMCSRDIANRAFVSETQQGDPNDANNTSSVSTTLNCTAAPTPGCGDNVMDGDGLDNTIGTPDDEECDFGKNGNSLCSPQCKSTFCGDGIVQNPNGNGRAEECDEGNNVQEGTCTSECTKTFCGDGVVQNPNGNNEREECDEDSPICTDDCKKIQFPEL